LGDVLALSAGFRFSAQAEYANALRLDPNYAPAHLALGLILAETPGREAEAIAHLEAGLRGQPESTAARAALARLKGR
jgi:tetratricopeptide (TPR) repeat protein